MTDVQSSNQQLPDICCNCGDSVTVLLAVDRIPIVGACSLEHLALLMPLSGHLGARRVVCTVDEFRSAVETPARRWPKYTNSIGNAGSDYLKSVSLDGRYTLSGTFRWYELWDAMNRAVETADDPLTQCLTAMREAFPHLDRARRLPLAEARSEFAQAAERLAAAMDRLSSLTSSTVHSENGPEP